MREEEIAWHLDPYPHLIMFGESTSVFLLLAVVCVYYLTKYTQSSKQREY